MLAILLLVFASSMGVGVVTPVLPRLLDIIQPGLTASEIAWHTGLLTGIYTFMGFGFARVWGQASDRRGRRRILLIAGAGNFAAVAMFPLASSLSGAYVLRILGGLFAAGIVPVSQAWMSDVSPQPIRARRFAALSIASLLGFLIGPVAGAFLMDPSTTRLPSLNVAGGRAALPFLAAATLGTVAWFVCLLTPRTNAPAYGHVKSSTAHPGCEIPSLMALVTLGAAVTFAIGAFEVGLTLLASQTLQLPPGRLAAMFVECSVVMIFAQLLISFGVFDRLAPRWIIAVALFAAIIAFAAVPFVNSATAMSAAIASIAGAAGILMPLLAYWTSIRAEAARGAGLGTQSSFASLGQAFGSSVGGGVFSLSPTAPFIAAAAVVLMAWVSSHLFATSHVDSETY